MPLRHLIWVWVTKGAAMQHAPSLATEAITLAPPNPRAAAKPMVRHFRQTFLWPIYLLPIKAPAQIQDHCSYLLECVTGGPWQELADEFTGDPAEFQERHYNEFVTF